MGGEKLVAVGCFDAPLALAVTLGPSCSGLTIFRRQGYQVADCCIPIFLVLPRIDYACTFTLALAGPP